MFEYKETEKFDIGAGYGEYEYDFFTINGDDDFWALVKHYVAVYRWFDYFLEGHKKKENNTRLSPVVQAKMKEHNANLCLTLVEKGFYENEVWIRQMVVNEQKLNGIYETYFFYFYHFTIVRAKDHFERGRACIKPCFYNAAIRHFSCAIKLDPSMGLAFMYRGFSYLRIQEYDKAIEDLTQAINSNMEKIEMSSAFSFRGLAYKEAGDFDKARADFAKALELDPDDEWAKEGLEDINKT